MFDLIDESNISNLTFRIPDPQPAAPNPHLPLL
jgi:hypothetical protein